MDKKAIRTENFFRLIKEAGNVSKLSRACGLYQSCVFTSVTCAVGKKMRKAGRGISSVLATKLEQGMKKPKGWMDKRHRDETQPVSGNKQTVDFTHSLITDNGGRIVSVTRNTKETQITITINLDGSGKGDLIRVCRF